MIPDTEYLIRVGNRCLAEDRPDEAIVYFKQVLELKPDDLGALNHVGYAYLFQARLDDAIACFRKALNADGSCVQAHDNLLFTLQYSPDYDAAAIFAECRRWNERHAATLASNLDRLRGLRSTLRPQMERSPLMDSSRFTRHLEATYRQLWHGWCQG